VLPPLDEQLADFAALGFRTDRPAARRLLERRAGSFVNGFNAARSGWRSPHVPLQRVDAVDRGFAYEGAAMAAAVIDLATLGRARALRTLRAGPGSRYEHLIAVGVGWAMARARLPGPQLWELDPLLRWLAHDGAGFADTFLTSGAAIERAAAVTGARRAVWLQGAGRALWFIEAGAVEHLAPRIARRHRDDRPHLWSGIGLAATYAGGTGPDDLAALRSLGGDDRTHLEQGAIFGAAARLRAGVVPGFTTASLMALTGLDVPTAGAWADEAALGLVTSASTIADYLRWRRRLRERVGGSSAASLVGAS